jgi:hypothetical protein
MHNVDKSDTKSVGKTDQLTHSSLDRSKPKALRDRFLYHAPFGNQGMTGIGHQCANLWTLLAEAVYLNRTAILPPLLLTGIHNNGIPLKTNWDRYIDTNAFEQVVKVCPSNVIESVEFDTIRKVNESHLPRTLLNEQAQLIVREFSGHHAFELLGSIKNSRELLKKLDSLLKPSLAVMELAYRIRTRLGDYDCIHVRRTDKLTELRYPDLDRKTRPDHIRKRISGWIEEGRKLYIMSDEKDDLFFKPLSSFYRVQTIFDFPELLAIRTSGDNYFAFEVEKLLFNWARVRVGTFKNSWDRSEFSLVDYSTRGKITLARIISWAKSISKRLLQEWRRRDPSYQRFVDRVRRVAEMRLPRDAGVIVLGDCENELLQLGSRQTWSLPYGHDTEQERLFAEGVGGTKEITWLQRGRIYEFSLYAGKEHRRRLATARVVVGKKLYDSATKDLDLDGGKALLTAQLSLVPSRDHLAKGIISWNTGDGSGGQVFVNRKDVQTRYPANGAALTDEMEQLRLKGAEFLLAPRNSFRLFTQYPALKIHLDKHYQLLAAEKKVCLIYDLRERLVST